jgi:sugar/nucleoside kinase (ribokinase family)
MYDLVTIGDSTVDMFLLIDEATLNCDIKTNECQICFTYADKIPINGAIQAIGGNAANVAAGGAKLGLKTAIVTEVGEDINGLLINDDLTKIGVNTNLVHINKGKETRYSVVLSYKGERTILSYHAPRTYQKPKLPTTKAIYYTSLGKTFERIQDEVIAYKKKHKTLILACNPGSYQFGQGIQKTRQILPFTDILFVNKEEAEKITQSKGTIQELIALLHTKGVRIVVVTDGSRGSYVSNGESLYHMPRFPVKTLSRTGAGDAYASGFISAYLSGLSIPQAMSWGTANASGVVQKFGGHAGALTKKQIATILKKYSSIKPKLLT